MPKIMQQGQPDPDTRDLDGKVFRSKCWEDLYHWDRAVADAVRLIGAADECFPPERIHVSFENGTYSVPPLLQQDRRQVFKALEKERLERKFPLFDGPCVRLASCDASPRDASEDKHLELVLGRMTWYDYVLANQRFNDPLIIPPPIGCNIADFVNLDALARTGELRFSKLSNILNTYLTLTTSDGFIVYSQRGGRVACYQNLFISAVSENLHPDKDGTFGPLPAESLFHTVARGISEELSPMLVPSSPSTDILLLGIAFQRMAYHPGLLFYLPLSQTRSQLEAVCRQFRGTDFQEGRLRFAKLGEDAEIEDALSREEWFAGGKASVIRTLEYLSSVGKKSGLSLSQAASHIGRSPRSDDGANRIFISYSHKDKKFLGELQRHLKPFERSTKISSWSDEQIQPGSRFLEEIKNRLAESRAIVMLVTKDFLASEFIHEHEFHPALKKAQAGGARIVWVLVRDCSYKETPLKDYQAAISPAKPLAQMKAERDGAWVKVCEVIKYIVD
jgi:hypothetical protein